MVRSFAVAVAAIIAGAASANAATLVSVQEGVVLNPGESGSVQILISGGDPIQGATLYPEISGAAPLPQIVDGEIVVGTIFASNNNGLPSYDFADPMTGFLDVATNAGTVTGTGVLATIQIDVPASTPFGVYPIAFLGTQFGDSEVFRVGATGEVTFQPGSISVVPEPASLALIGLAGAGMLRRRRA